MRKTLGTIADDISDDGPAVPRPRRHRTRKHKRSVTGAEAGLGSCCSEIHDESHSIEGTDKAVVGAGDLLAATNSEFHLLIRKTLLFEKRNSFK